ncbi:MAG: 3-dehydroquinase [Patescibacteria group bacterium]|nr:MAG: 3-dehydroquinase [Patescibacteria group bacterium]
MTLIATSITANNNRDCLKQAKDLEETAEILELRADYLKTLNKQFLAKFKKTVAKPVILTIRDKKEGGINNYSLEEKLRLIKTAQDLNYDLIDLEYRNYIRLNTEQKRIIDKTKLILSWHNFSKTNSFNYLINLATKMKKEKPKIIKIAVMTNNNNDVNSVLKLQININYPKIIIGMGEKGKLTRVSAFFTNCYLTFSSNNFNSSAPGQINIDTMIKIKQLLSDII